MVFIEIVKNALPLNRHSMKSSIVFCVPMTALLLRRMKFLNVISIILDNAVFEVAAHHFVIPYGK